jgi:hypothetical protein
MVDCCANPTCRAEFKMLHSGDLYALERRAADTEFFWLCSECAPQLDLVLNVEGHLSFRPQCDARHARPVDPNITLRLISRAASHNTWRDAAPSDEPRATKNFSRWGGFAS